MKKTLISFITPHKRRDKFLQDTINSITVLNQLVEAHPHWGFWKYVDRLRALDYGWDHKYCGLGLNQPRRTQRKLPEREREPLFVPARQDQVWSTDFVSNALYYGTRFRTFNVIDDHNREALAIDLIEGASCGAGAAEGAAWRARTASCRQRTGVPESGVCRLVQAEQCPDSLYPARETKPECLYRTF